MLRSNRPILVGLFETAPCRKPTVEWATAELGSPGDVGDVRLVSGGRGGSGPPARAGLCCGDHEAVVTKDTLAGGRLRGGSSAVVTCSNTGQGVTAATGLGAVIVGV